MKTLKSTTKRDISGKMFLALLVITLACLSIFALVAYLYSIKAASFAFLGTEMLLFCYLPAWSARMAKRRKAEREQWLSEYRASPESHLLHLID